MAATPLSPELAEAERQVAVLDLMATLHESSGETDSEFLNNVLRLIFAGQSGYDAVAAIANDNGFAVTAADLEGFVEPWSLLSRELRGLLDQNVIDE